MFGCSILPFYGSAVGVPGDQSQWKAKAGPAIVSTGWDLYADRPEKPGACAACVVPVVWIFSVLDRAWLSRLD
eukprot:SAG31_NODE_45276_length_259_cov_0.968750_1_plen_72_part_10